MVHAPVIRDADTSPRHKSLPRALSLILDVLPENLVALPRDEAHQREPHHQRTRQQDDVDGNRVVVEGEMGGGIEAGLSEVEDAGETDDEAVDFAEGGEAEDFGRVVAA